MYTSILRLYLRLPEKFFLIKRKMNGTSEQKIMMEKLFFQRLVLDRFLSQSFLICVKRNFQEFLIIFKIKFFKVFYFTIVFIYYILSRRAYFLYVMFNFFLNFIYLISETSSPQSCQRNYFLHVSLTLLFIKIFNYRVRPKNILI